MFFHMCLTQLSYSDNFLSAVRPFICLSIHLSVHLLTLSNNNSAKAIEVICP